MTVSVPIAISIPVDIEETSHIIIFNNGDMALVQERPESRSDTRSLYKENFATTHIGMVILFTVCQKPIIQLHVLKTGLKPCAIQ